MGSSTKVFSTYRYRRACFTVCLLIWACLQEVLAAQLLVAAELFSGYNILGAPYISQPYTPGVSSVDLNLSAAGIVDALPSGASFNGAARASADYGTLKTYVSADINNYEYMSYSYEPLPGMITPGTIATATARIEDVLTVNSSVNGFMEVSFSIDGTMNFINNFALSGFTSILARVNGVSAGLKGYYSDVSETITFSLPYVANSPNDVAFNLYTELTLMDDGPGSMLPEPYSINPIIDFSNTATLSDILITDDQGLPINGATIIAESGFAYPVSNLNAVPVPAAVWLFSSGLLGLIGVTRRKERI